MGYPNTYFLYNVADTLTLVMAVMMIVPFVSILREILPNVNFMINADNFVRGRFLIGIINLTYLRIAFLTILNYSTFGSNSNSSGFNSFAAVCGLVYIIVVPLYYLM